MAKKRKHVRRSGQRKQVAHLRVRLPEMLRYNLERAAAKNNRSINQELISRLRESFHELGTPSLIAQALIDTLDDSVLDAMKDLMVLTALEVKDEAATVRGLDAIKELIEDETTTVLTALEVKDEMNEGRGGDLSQTEGLKHGREG